MRVLARAWGSGPGPKRICDLRLKGTRTPQIPDAARLGARRGPGWEEGDLEFFIKAGKDQDNFYMYHTPARTTSWEPEVVVQFERWLILARASSSMAVGRQRSRVSRMPDSTLVPNDGPSSCATVRTSPRA